MYRWFPLLFVVSGLPLVRADNIVANFSTATKEYLSEQTGSETPVRQSYAILQGKYFPGRIRDRGLEKTSFATVARVVSRALQKKNTSPTFYPAKSLSATDLLIVVHWGVTIGRDRNFYLEDRDYQKMSELARRGADYDAALKDPMLVDEPITAPDNPLDSLSNPMNHPHNQSIGHQLDYLLQENTTRAINDATRGRDVAALLGFSSDLRKDQNAAIASEHTRSLFHLMEEDRYFILVYAYDMKRLRKDKQLVVNWTTRLSIRSAGVNFATAINRMSEAGAATFGSEPGEVKFATVKIKKLKEDITIGDPIIIETIP